jgi:small GTP-binding protein
MSENLSTSEFFKALEERGIVVTPEDRERIERRFNERLNYVPKIGVFGKTGVGKSSLCNAVFGQDVCGVSDIDACTRNPQEVLISIGGNGLKLVDIPGVGESLEREEEYEALYRQLLPEMDIVLWVLKADDRAYSTDERHYKELVQPIIKKSLNKQLKADSPFFVVLNQVDKVDPFREWDLANAVPGPQQAKNIEQKRASVANFFDIPLATVIPVSADQGYGLVSLVDSLVFAVPAERKHILLKATRKVRQSKAAQKAAKSGWWEGLIDIGKTILSDWAIPAVIAWAKRKAGF